MARASILRAPSRRTSVRTSWPVGRGTMRMSVVESFMAGYSSAPWAIWCARNGCITKDTPPPFKLPYTTFGYTPTPEELDRALGNGAALTALIRPENPYHGVEFKTVWDVL